MMRAKSVALAGLALLLGSCGDAPQCPEAWENESNRGRSCKPPEDVRAAAETRLRTGIFGFVLTCHEESAEDDCSCEETGLMDVESPAARYFPLRYVDAEGAWQVLEVPVREDATFEVELIPGVEYEPDVIDPSFGDPPVVQGSVTVTIENRRGGPVQLVEGDVVFARVWYGPC